MLPYNTLESEIRILLADDDILFLELIKEFLEKSGGINVTTVSDTLDAVELLSGEKYDVIVSDYYMPGMDGIEFLKYVRSNYGNIPFILFTGKGHEDVAIEAINNCADYYINKNEDTKAQFKELESKIRSVASEGFTEKALKQRYLFEKTISGISSRFVNFSDFKDAVDKSLCDLGSITHADYVNFYLSGNDNNSYNIVNSWIRDGLNNGSESSGTLKGEKISWLLKELSNKKYLFLPTYDKISEEGAEDCEYFSGKGIKSLILLPVKINGLLQGFISIENFRVSNGCTPRNIDILKVASDIFGGAIERLRKESLIIEKNEELTAYNDTISAAEEELRQQLEILLESQRLLIESEEKYSLLFRSLNSGFALHQIITDDDGKPVDYRFIEVNPAFEKITGLKSRDIAGKTVLEVLPDIEEYWIENYGKVALTGEPLLTENYCNELSEYFSVSAYSPKPGYFATVFSDITGRKNAEEKAEQFGKILDNSLNEIYIFDTDDFRFHHVNRGARVNLGYSEGELKKMTPVDLKPEFTFESFEKFVAPLKSGEAEYVDFITVHERKDGSFYPVKVHLQITESGEKKVFSAIIMDITDRVESERELDRSRFILDEALNGSRAGLWEYDCQRNLIKIKFNKTWEDILGYSLDDFPEIAEKWVNSEIWLNLVHPDDLSYVIRKLNDCISGISDYYDSEYRMMHKYGNWVWVHARGRVKSPDAEGMPTVIYGTHTDVTDRKNAEELLRLSNDKLKILSEISRHDILNQISALKVYTMFSKEIVLDECINPKLDEYLDKIQNGLNVVMDQIEFSRSYQNLGIEKPKWHKLSDVIGKCSKNGLLFRESCNRLSVCADPMIEKVFNNLIENTLRHGTNPSSVSIYYELDDKCCKIIYEDDGGGIPDKNKGMIFNRGFGNNTGMGLFLTKEILSITGITINENGKSGFGVRFELKVPDGMWRLEDN